MTNMSLLLVACLSAIAVFALITMGKALFASDNKILECIFAVVLGLIFTGRLLFLKSGLYIRDSFSLDNIKILIFDILMWLEVSAIIFLVLRPFFKFNSAIWYGKYFPLVIFFLSIIALPFAEDDILTLSRFDIAVVLAIELGYGLGLSVYNLLNDFDKKLIKEKSIATIFAVIFINIFTVPSYFMGYISGSPVLYNGLSNITYAIIHLIFTMLPLTLFFIMRNFEQSKIKYFLLFIALSGCVKLIEEANYFDLFAYWKLPLDLCKLSLILITIGLIFNSKKISNYVLLVGVVGCLFSIFVKHYKFEMGESIFSSEIVSYYYIHFIVIWVAVLSILLKVFPTPKPMDVVYSTIVFSIYYVLILFINVVSNGIDVSSISIFGEYPYTKGSKYMFNNDVYILSKLHIPSDKIYNITIKFSINENNFVLRPILNLIYYLAYIVLIFAPYYLCVLIKKIFTKKNKNKTKVLAEN